MVGFLHLFNKKQISMKKYLPLVIKYLPDALFQVGILFLVANLDTFESCSDPRHCYVSEGTVLGIMAVSLGANLVLRRYFTAHNSGK